MLVAGAVRMPVPRFVAAVFAGRMIRFGGEAYLAVRLGDQALETLQRYYPLVGAVLAGAVVVYLTVKWLRRRRAHAATGG
jgi:membrane protein DedA with SNARE-associated domain